MLILSISIHYCMLHSISFEGCKVVHTNLKLPNLGFNVDKRPDLDVMQEDISSLTQNLARMVGSTHNILPMRLHPQFWIFTKKYTRRRRFLISNCHWDLLKGQWCNQGKKMWIGLSWHQKSWWRINKWSLVNSRQKKLASKHEKSKVDNIWRLGLLQGKGAQEVLL